jgi:hypothetical protein
MKTPGPSLIVAFSFDPLPASEASANVIPFAPNRDALAPGIRPTRDVRDALKMPFID